MIIDQFTKDLPGVVAVFDDILIRGQYMQNLLCNLEAILQHLSDRGLRCCVEKCEFVKPWLDYLEHLLPFECIAK